MKNEPEYKYKIGQIEGTVWINEKEGKNGKYKQYTTTITKTYLTKDGDPKNPKDWKTTNTYNTDELPVLNIITTNLYTYCKTNKQKLRE